MCARVNSKRARTAGKCIVAARSLRHGQSLGSLVSRPPALGLVHPEFGISCEEAFDARHAIVRIAHETMAALLSSCQRQVDDAVQGT